MSKEEAAKILTLIMQLKKVDENAVFNLERLVKMAKTNPAKYHLALKFL